MSIYILCGLASCTSALRIYECCLGTILFIYFSAYSVIKTSHWQLERKFVLKLLVMHSQERWSGSLIILFSVVHCAIPSSPCRLWKYFLWNVMVLCLWVCMDFFYSFLFFLCLSRRHQGGRIHFFVLSAIPNPLLGFLFPRCSQLSCLETVPQEGHLSCVLYLLWFISNSNTFQIQRVHGKHTNGRKKRRRAQQKHPETLENIQK